MSNSQSYSFKIRTTNGSIIDNVVIQARNIDEARYRLDKRYPNATIMSAKVK